MVQHDGEAEIELQLVTEDGIGLHTLTEFQSTHGTDEVGIGPATLEALGVDVPDQAPIVYLRAGAWDFEFCRRGHRRRDSVLSHRRSTSSKPASPPEQPSTGGTSGSSPCCPATAR